MPKNNLLYTQRFLRYCTWLLIAASILSIYYVVQQVKAANLQQTVQPQAVTVGEVPAENVTLLGHIGGENYAMKVQGSYAYLGLGPELAVFDINNPDDPRRLGYWVFPDIINDIEVIGSRAYVTDEANKFWIVDISNPAAPLPLYEANTPDAGRTIHVQDDVAYIVLQNGSLWLADISTPSAVTEIGIYNPTGDIQDIYIAGDIAYLATADTGLGVIDISDPTTPPTEITYYEEIGDAGQLYLDGNRLYVVDWGNSVWVMDVSAPASPRELGIYETIGGNISVSGSVAYVTDEFMGLTLVDLTNPNSPTELGAHPDINFVNQIAVQDTFAYMTDDRGRLRIMDMTSMNAPQLRGTYQTPVSAGKIHVDGPTAFVGDPNGRLSLVDVTDPANPVGRSSLTTFVSDIYAASGKAYVAGSSDGLRIIDGVNPATPTELGSYNVYAPAKGIHVTSDVAYIATGSQGLRIVDVADSANATELTLYDTPGNAQAVYIAGSAAGIMAYVADDDGGLQIIDVTVPSQPVTLGAYNNPDRNIINVYVSDTTAYLIDSHGGLSIIDASVPSSPRELGVYDDSFGIAQSVYAVGDMLYVANGTNGLQIINVAIPSIPTLAGFYSLPGNASDIIVDQNNVIYVTGRDGGLFILKYANAGTQPSPTPTFTPRPISTATPTFAPANTATAMPTVQPSATALLVETPTEIATGVATTAATTAATTVATSATWTPTTDPGAAPTATPAGCVDATVSINAPESVVVGEIFNVILSFTGTGEQWWYVSQHEHAPNIEAVVDGSEYRALLPGEVTYWIGLDSDCGESAMKTVIIKVLEASASTPVATSNATPTPTFTLTVAPTATPTLTPEPTDTPIVCIPPAISMSAPEEVFIGDNFTAILSFSGTGNQWWYLDQDEADPVVATITEGSVYQALRAGEVIFRAGIDSPCVSSIIEVFNIAVVARPTATLTATETETVTPIPTVTPTPTATWTLAPNVTPSNMTSTPTSTLMPTLTPTLIPTMTSTVIPTVTPASGPTETCLLPTLTENIPESVQIGETFTLDLIFSGTGKGWWYVDQDENDPILKAIIDGQVYKSLRAGEVTIRAGIDSPCSDPVNRSYTTIVGDLPAATPATTATADSTMTPIPPTPFPSPSATATLDLMSCSPPIVNFTSPEEVKLGEMLTFSLTFQNAESEWWYVDQEPRNPLVKAIDPDSEAQITYRYETLRAGEVIIRAGATSGCTSPVSRSWIVVVIDETTPTPTGSVITPATTPVATSEATLITLSTATLIPTLIPTLTPTLTPTPEDASNNSLTGTISGNQQQRQPISGPLPYAINLENYGITTLTDVVLILDSAEHQLDSANPSNRNWQQVGDQYHLSIGDINSDGAMTTVFYVNPMTPDIIVTDPEDAYLQIDAPEVTVSVAGQPFAALVPTGEKLIWCCLPLASTPHTIYLPLITR